MNKEVLLRPMVSLSPREVLQNTSAAIKDLEDEGHVALHVSSPPSIRAYRDAMHLKAEIIAGLLYYLDQAIRENGGQFPVLARQEIEVLSTQAEDALIADLSFDQHILLHSFGEKPEEPNDLEKVIYAVYSQENNELL